VRRQTDLNKSYDEKAH